MKFKKLLLGIFATMSVSYVSAANIAKTTSSITIDGSMDAAYNNSTVYKIEKTAVGNENNEVGQWRAAFDDDYFYFFVEIICANPWGNDAANAWNGDAVELYIKDSGGAAKQYIFAYKSGTNVVPTLYSNKDYTNVDSKMTTVSKSYDGVTKGYNVEIRIKKSQLGFGSLTTGNSFYMELGCDRANSGHTGRASQIATWNASDQHYQSTNGYSQVSLIDPSKPVISAENGKTKVCANGGSFVSLNVESALAGSEVTYLWKKDGSAYTGKNYNNNNIRPCQAGNYICEVSVDGITYTSNTITVTADGGCPDKTFDTYLPIVIVNTNGQGFPRDLDHQAGMSSSIKDKRTVDVKIIWNEDGSLNNVNQTSDPNAVHYDRKAIMNHRGSTSCDMVKKPYAFRTCKKDLENGAAKKGNFSMLGMPEEKDWILYASYGDKSLMRNRLAMDLYYMMGYWQSDFRFVELFVDNNYRGVYLMMEKITRDKNRVNITKDEANNTDPAACGYIWKLDKTDKGDAAVWYRTEDNCGGKCGDGGCGDQSYGTPQGYELIYPEDDAANYSAKKDYIKGVVSNFEKALNAANNDAGFSGVYQNNIDLQSFADYFIISELAKCSDEYRVSVYFTKDTGGKIKISPIWDFDMGFGNSTTHGSFNPQTWQYNADGVNEAYFPIPFWWKKLITNSCFKNVVRTRWHELRQNIFRESDIFARIDAMYEQIGVDLNGVGGTSPSSRNKSRWSWDDINNCGGYDCPWHVVSWPSGYPATGKTTSLSSQEIPNMKEWIHRRLQWLDSQIDNDSFGTILTDMSSCTHQEEETEDPHYRTDIEEIAENGEINISAQDGVLSIEALTEGDEIENVEIVSVNGSVLFAAKAIKSQNYQVEVPQTEVIIVKVQTQMSSVTKMMFVE